MSGLRLRLMLQQEELHFRSCKLMTLEEKLYSWAVENLEYDISEGFPILRSLRNVEGVAAFFEFWQDAPKNIRAEIPRALPSRFLSDGSSLRNYRYEEIVEAYVEFVLRKIACNVISCRSAEKGAMTAIRKGLVGIVPNLDIGLVVDKSRQHFVCSKKIKCGKLETWFDFHKGFAECSHHLIDIEKDQRIWNTGRAFVSAMGLQQQRWPISTRSDIDFCIQGVSLCISKFLQFVEIIEDEHKGA